MPITYPVFMIKTLNFTQPPNKPTNIDTELLIKILKDMPSSNLCFLIIQNKMSQFSYQYKIFQFNNSLKFTKAKTMSRILTSSGPMKVVRIKKFF